MYTLALDTATDGISVAVLDGKNIKGQDYRTMERGQGEALVPMIGGVVRDSGITMSDIGQVAVSVGPGSFTGVRIGLATARGIGLALNIPVLGVSTLESMAFHYSGTVMVAIDTKRGDFYTQIFKDGIPQEKANTRTIEQIKEISPLLITGSGLSALAGITEHLIERSDCLAVQVGLCALENSREPEPIYLREADVSCQRTN